MDTMIQSIEDMIKQRDELNKQISKAERDLERCISRPCRIQLLNDPSSYHGKKDIENLKYQYYVIIPKEMITLMGVENTSSCFENIELIDRNTLMIKVTNRLYSTIFESNIQKYIDSKYEHKLQSLIQSIETIIEHWECGIINKTPETLIERIKQECDEWS